MRLTALTFIGVLCFLAGNGSATAASDARRRSVAHRPLAHTLLRSSPVTLNTFTVETAGSALSFHDDTLLSDLTGNLNPGTLNPGSGHRVVKAESAQQQDALAPIRPSTKTVYGFLDFTTTVGDTVMIFKPSKAPGDKRKNSGSRKVTAEEKVKPSAPVAVATTVAADGIRGSAASVQLESSLVELEDRQAAKSGRAEHGSEGLQEKGRAGIGSVVSMFPLRSHVVVSSRVDVRIGGVSKLVGVASKPRLSASTLLPKPVSVRIGMNFGNDEEDEVSSVTTATPKPKNSRSRPSIAPTTPALDIVSKTVGTVIRNGMTTVHETSVLRTTINGQIGHAVVSTSRVFQDTTRSVVPTLGRGSVEVVTELPSINSIGSRAPTPAAEVPALEPPTPTSGSALVNQRVVSSPAPREPPKEVAAPVPAPSTTTKANPVAPASTSAGSPHKEPLPSLESLFESVGSSDLTRDSQALQQADPSEQPARAERLTQTPEDEEPQLQSPPPSSPGAGFRAAGSIQRPSIVPAPQSINSSPNSNPLERRAGVSPKLGQASRPFRREGNRGRYTPAPKPLVPIPRTEPRSPARDYERRPFISSNVELEGSLGLDQRASSAFDQSAEVKTLRVHTVTPQGISDYVLEVATIQAPYVIRLGAVRNTRFITTTKTKTRLVTRTPEPELLPAIEALLDDRYVDEQQDYPQYQDEPGFDGDVIDENQEPEILHPDPSLPLAENILATTAPYENILKDSSDTATLPPIIVAATESDSLELETVTETFSTEETMMKTSILPYLRAGETSLMTLTQTYFITRLITAIKTVPPADWYQFIPSRTLTDLSTILQEAGSEHNSERLLPGELEFSENDEYPEDDGPHEKRVPAPASFLQESDLALIGQDFDPSSMEKPIVQLEPSIVSTLEASADGQSSQRLPTPPLPDAAANYRPTPQQLEPSFADPNTNSPPVLTPEQLQQLALYRYMNPYAAVAAGLPFGYPGGYPGALPGFGGAGTGGGVQVIQTSRPVVRTSDIVKTQVLPIRQGGRTIYSTITRTLGTTTVTETEYGTTTVNLPSMNAYGQQISLVTSPVVTESMTTSTELRIYRIIFRAQTTYTTVTSTHVFPTEVTSYVTSTMTIQPTAFPGFGFGFPGFAG